MNDILIFGDSIVEGKGVKKNKSWPSLLANILKIEVEHPIAVHNFGVPGNTTSDVISRFPSEIELKCKDKNNDNYCTIIFSIGINDSKIVNSFNNILIKIFEKNICQLIKLAKKYTDNIFFVGITSVNEDVVNFKNKEIQKYNNILKKTCIDSGAFFIDIRDSWLNGKQKDLLASDGIHPNEKGHIAIYKKVFDHLKSIIEDVD